MAEFDINKVKGNDRFIAGGAILLLVVSFFPWYAVSSNGGLGLGGGASGNLWNIYGLLKLALLLALIAGALVLARLMGALDNVSLPVGVNLLTLVLSGLATAIFTFRLLGSFDSFGSGDFKVSAHPSFGWYIGIAISAAMTYFAFLNFKASGEQMPNKPGTAPPPAAP